MEPLRSHLLIPDTQAKPGVPTDHLRWIGNYIVDHFADRNLAVIHIGDHADMPSLSSYDKGKLAMEGRRINNDIDAANDAWRVLNDPLEAFNARRRQWKEKQWWPDRFITMGNHEDRITRAVEADPALQDFLTLDLLDYRRSGWTVVDYLVPLELDGVTYCHYFYNPMTGRPYGGENIQLRLKTIGHSFTMGHQQGLWYSPRPTLAGMQHGLVAGACYLHDEGYKGPQGNNHWRGIVVCHEVDEGDYSIMVVSLKYLCRRYEGVSLSEFMAGKYPRLQCSA